MIATDAGRAASPPPPPPPPGPSFLRRHPLLAGFGVLAGLSLFAAYWPLSAIVTGGIVAARASGVDRIALGILRRTAAQVVERVTARLGRASGPGSAAPDPPGASGPDHVAEHTRPGPPDVSLAPPTAPGRDVPTPRRSRARRPVASSEATRGSVEL